MSDNKFIIKNYPDCIYSAKFTNAYSRKELRQIYSNIPRIGGVLHDELIKKYMLDNTEEGSTIEKLENNALYADNAKSLVTKDKTSLILYIDGPSGRTTEMLLDSKIPPENCIAVNKSKIHFKSRKVKSYTCYFDEAIQILASQDELRKVKSVWYDGCGTLLGSQISKIFPLNDLELLFSLMKCDFTLALSFNTRANHNQRSIQKYLNKSDTEEEDHFTDGSECDEDDEQCNTKNRELQYDSGELSDNNSHCSDNNNNSHCSDNNIIKKRKLICKKKIRRKRRYARGLSISDQKRVLRSIIKRSGYSVIKYIYDKNENYSKNMFFWMAELKYEKIIS